MNIHDIYLVYKCHNLTSADICRETTHFKLWVWRMSGYDIYPANYGDKAIRAASQGEMSVCLSCNQLRGQSRRNPNA